MGAQVFEGAAGLGETGAGDGKGMVQHGAGFGGGSGGDGLDGFQVDRQAAEGVGEGVVQLARQAVALAAGGQLLEGLGVLGELEVGLDEGFALEALGFDQAVNDVPDGAEGKGANQRGAEQGNVLGIDLADDGEQDGELDQGAEYNKEHHDPEGILPGDEHQGDDQNGQEQPGAGDDEVKVWLGWCGEVEEVGEDGDDGGGDQGKRQVPALEAALEPGQREVDEEDEVGEEVEAGLRLEGKSLTSLDKGVDQDQGKVEHGDAGEVAEDAQQAGFDWPIQGAVHGWIIT